MNVAQLTSKQYALAFLVTLVTPAVQNVLSAVIVALAFTASIKNAGIHVKVFVDLEQIVWSKITIPSVPALATTPVIRLSVATNL